MTDKKFVEIPSFNYFSIDELIEKLEQYKKLYGGESYLTIDMCQEYDDHQPEIYYGINVKSVKNEHVIYKNNNLIPEWCTHGKARETYFEYRFDEGRHFWWCTHGGWEFESDNSGKILDSWFHNEDELKHLRNLKIDKFFNREEYMKEFGEENPYEN